MGKKHAKKQAAPVYPGAPVETHKKWRMAALVVAIVLAVSVAAAHFVLREQPRLIVWLLGAVCAAGAALVYVLATHEPEHDDLVLRIQRGQHLDFGKRLRDTRKQRRKVKLPLLGETSLRALGGGAIAVLVFGWWLTPLAPVRVAQRKIEDLSVPLSGEILSVVLVMPDPHLATAQVPIVSARARHLAQEIPDHAEPYQRGQKAIAQRQFDSARELLASALEGGQTDPADVHVAMAQTELYAFRFEEAVKEYQKALATKKDDPGILCQSAVAAIHANRYAEAERLVIGAIKPLEDKPEASRSANDSAALAAALHLRAVLYTIRGRTPQELDDAERLFDRAKEIQRKESVFGEEHPYVAATINNQAVLYQLRAKYPGVQALYNQARDVWRSSLGEKHSYGCGQLGVAASLGNLAMFHFALGHYSDAQECNRQALAIRREAFPADPPDSPVLAVGLLTTSILERTFARYDAARVPAEQALLIFEKTFGPDHPNIAACVNEIASLYVDLARYLTIARPFFLRAEAVTTKTLGPEHPYRAVTLNELANLYLAQKQYPQAREATQQALGIAKNAYGEEHPVTATILNTQGRLEIAQQQLPKARPYLEKALQIEETVLGKEHPDVAATMGSLAALDNSPITYAKGVNRYQRAIEITEEALGRGEEEHPAVARLLYNLAALLAQRGKDTEAEPYLKRGLDIQEKVLVPSQPFHPDLADTLEAYAALLRRTDPAKTEQADKMEARAKDIREKHFEEDRPKTRSP
jgi:tetratricopeptide (TPR) repeat protein